jgi:hypothetical protein
VSGFVWWDTMIRKFLSNMEFLRQSPSYTPTSLFCQCSFVLRNCPVSHDGSGTPVFEVEELSRSGSLGGTMSRRAIDEYTPHEAPRSAPSSLATRKIRLVQSFDKQEAFPIRSKTSSSPTNLQRYPEHLKLWRVRGLQLPHTE